MLWASVGFSFSEHIYSYFSNLKTLGLPSCRAGTEAHGPTEVPRGDLYLLCWQELLVFFSRFFSPNAMSQAFSFVLDKLFKVAESCHIFHMKKWRQEKDKSLSQGSLVFTTSVTRSFAQ